MVMKLNTGVPGSGKTYLMVKSFIDLFCKYDKETERFILSENHQDKILISNIAGLTLPHQDIESMMNDRCMQLAKAKFVQSIGKNPIDLDDMPEVIDEFYFKFMSEKVRWFFSYDYQEQLLYKHGPIIYLIEESQRYFDSKELGRAAWVRDVLFFFEKHRHFGFSIFCDTQHSSKLHKGIVALFETETRAKPRTLSVIGEFKYNEYTDGAKTNQIPIVVKPDQRVFKAYKSMSHKEDVKTKKPALKILIFVCVMAVLAVFVLKYAKQNLGGGVAHAKTQKIEKNQEIKTEQNKLSWKMLSYWVDQNNQVTVIHPITSAFVPLIDLEFQAKLMGTDLYCLCPVIEKEKQNDTTRTESSPLPNRKRTGQEQHNET